MTEQPSSAAVPLREGLIVVDKPAGLTSHDVVARLRRIVGTRRVGHAGTLDPMATGVLVCGIGRATRLLGLLALVDKEYLATIRLGVSTTSDDAEGEVVHYTPAHITATDIEGALAPLRGTISQRPSSVSAIKVDGKRAYARVRAGETVELPSREVTISVLVVTDIRQCDVDGRAVTDVDVRVVCSSGTYVRAIARDAGESLGVGGHLTALRRTRVGRYSIESAQPLDDLLREQPVEPRLISMADVARMEFPSMVVDGPTAVTVLHGARIHVEEHEAAGPGPVAVFDEAGRLLAVSDVVNGHLEHRMVLG